VAPRPANYVVDAEVDEAALRAELAAALGPEGSASWYLVSGVARAAVTYFAPIAEAKVRGVLDAHLAPGAIAARRAARLAAGAIAAGGAAREARALRRLARTDPVAALLKKGGMA
jgi:hypothetical protein